jgi:ABC-type phosphate transport system substrate-binding protein
MMQLVFATREIRISQTIALAVMAVSCAATVHASGEPARLRIAATEDMIPLLERMGKEFAASKADLEVLVSAAAPMVAPSMLMQDKCDIASIARSTTDEERLRVRNLKRAELVSVPIAMDAVVFVVNHANSAESLTLEQLAGIYSHKFSDWDQLGVPCNEQAQDKSIRKFGFSNGSGSRKKLAEAAMHGRGFPSDITTLNQNGEILEKVREVQGSLGFCGMGPAQGVKVLSIKIDAGTAPVFPTKETVQSRQYPFAHYLYLHFVGEPRGISAEFLAFSLSEKGQAIIRDANLGPVPLPLADRPNDANKKP